MKRLSFKQWETIFKNLAGDNQEVEVTWLDPGDTSAGKWCLHYEDELFEDGFASEKEANERLKYLQKTIQGGTYMYHVQIKSIETGEVVDQITKEPVSQSSAERIQRGALINLNRDEYFVAIVDA